MLDAHRVLAYSLVAVCGVAGVAGVVAYARRRDPGALSRQLLALAQTLLVAQVALGLLLLGDDRCAPDDLHCVVAWNARGPTYAPSEFEMHRADPRERLCTNPISWRTDGALAPATLHLGAVFLESDDPAPRVGLVGDARCVNGTLVLHHVGATPRDLPSRILDRVLGDGNYHAIEYQLFFMNIRENAAARVTAFLSAHR